MSLAVPDFTAVVRRRRELTHETFKDARRNRV